MSSFMEDVDVFPRQAVIVKNGKIFVEDEPFFCASDDDDDDDDDDLKNDDDIEENKENDDSSFPEHKDLKPENVITQGLIPLDSNRSTEDNKKDVGMPHSVEKEELISEDLVTENPDEKDDDDEEEEEDDSDENDEDYDVEERFLRLVDREEFFEDVDGLRLQGLPDTRFDGLLQGLPEGTSEGFRLQGLAEGSLDPAHYLDCFSSGQEVQRISVITALPALLKENNAECMRRVVPKVREVLYVAQQDMQVAAASAFLQILQDKLVPLHNYTQTFLQTILTSVDSKDPEVSSAWLSTLLSVIDLLPKEIIKKDILGIAINKGQLQQPVPVRLTCCKILGKIATCFDDPFLIKKEILPVVQQLCQDVDHDVRACMCYQLDSVAQGLGLEDTKSAILPELVELTNDEASDVRIAGLETVVKIIHMLDNETLIMTIRQLVLNVCQKSWQAKDCTLPVVAKHIGHLCLGLRCQLGEEDKKRFCEEQRRWTAEQKPWLVDFFKKLCTVGLSAQNKAKTCEQNLDVSYDEDDVETETRRNAADNFPRMVMFVETKHFKTELLGTITSLCKDPHFVVRKTIAASFHEVSKMLGNGVAMLFPDLSLLLRDENVEVLEGVVSTFPQCLEGFCRTGAALSETKLAAVQDVVNSFLLVEGPVFSSNNWRLQEAMMHNTRCLHRLCSQHTLHLRVIPILLAKMKHGRALPVRHAAARSLLILMRSLHKLEHREQLIQALILDFGEGYSCHSRSLFIVTCTYALELYSKAFFKEHLFESVLNLTSDPVPNIRRRTCLLLPSLKRLLRLPQDSGLKSLLEQCVRRVLSREEKDRDVRVAIAEADGELSKIQVLTDYSKLGEEGDEEDERKEREEKHLLEIEEQEGKEGERTKKNIGKKDGSKLPGPKKSVASKAGLGGAGLKLDIPPAGHKDLKGTSSSSSSSTASVGQTHHPPAVCNGSSAGRGQPSMLPHMIKSKSTTSIPSLSHIPRPEARPSTPPRKEAGLTRIPVFHSLPRSASSLAAGSGLTKLKSMVSPRTGNIPNATSHLAAQYRKGCEDSAPHQNTPRPDSTDIPGVTNNDCSAIRSMKAKTNIGSASSGSTTIPVPKKTRKVLKP